MQTFRALAFFPKHLAGNHPLNSRLDGIEFSVPEGAVVSVVETVNGRSLVKAGKPTTGYRYCGKGDFGTAEEAAIFRRALLSKK